MPRANLILLTVECWRGDHFGPLTPNLVRLGEESAVFSAAYSSGGWTQPAMTAMMSSAYASMFGGFTVGLATPERQLLAECLLPSGYSTAGFTANLICGTMNGFHRGFGTFEDARRKPRLPDGLAPEQMNWRRLVEMGIPPRDLGTFCDAAHMTDLGLRWIGNRQRDEPFFLWLHYMDPHWPCLTPDPPADHQQLHDAWYDRYLFRTEVIPNKGRYDPGEEARIRWTNRYRDALTSADREIGRLLAALRSRADWDRTVVAVAGDHGEEFYEHGCWHHGWNQLYREGIHVPLIVRAPGASPQRATHPVSQLDIAPTLLDYAGASQERTKRPMMGTSLRPAIEGREFQHRPVYTEMLGHFNGSSYKLAILDGEWKYIYDLEDPHHSKLFRVADDPAERDDLRERQQEVFLRFEKMRFAHVSLGLTRLLSDSAPQERQVEMDDLVKEQMIALGYLAAD